MLIVCPACSSAYEIDVEYVGATGRAVRCAACRETWFVTPDDVAAAQAPKGPVTQDDLDAMFTAMDEPVASLDDDVSAQDATIVDQPAPYQARSRETATVTSASRLTTYLPIAAFGLLVFVILPLALLGRSTVVRAMPQSAGIFAGIGLPVNLRGIDIRDVVAFQHSSQSDNPAEIVVEGDLVGSVHERVDMPDIEIELRDAQDRPIYRWSTPAPRPTLEYTETARFRVSLSAPPSQARTVLVRFADIKPPDAKPTVAKSDTHETAHTPPTLRNDEHKSDDHH